MTADTPATPDPQTPSEEAWPDPTLEMLNSREFEAIWQTIKTWDINVPAAYGGYCGATGNHVRAILDALDRFAAQHSTGTPDINPPEIEDFIIGALTEAQHQRARWGESHDRSKSAENWYWLVGYLAGKALRASIQGDREKALHHTIRAAAALSQWHEAIKRAPVSGNARELAREILRPFNGQTLDENDISQDSAWSCLLEEIETHLGRTDQHSTATPVSGDARARSNVIYDAALVDGTRGRSKLMAEQDIASITPHIEQAIIAGIAAALHAERAEGRRAMREEEMRRLTRICINEAPADMTPTQAANWAMGMAYDEIRALADTPGEDGIDG